MEAATLPPSLTVVPGGDASPTSTRVRLDGERIVVERLVVTDPTLAAFLAERPADDRADLIERAVRIGLSRSRTPASRSTWTSSGPSSRSSCARPNRSTRRRPRHLEQTLRHELRRRRRPAAAHAREVPGRPWRTALDGRRAVRRDEARQRDRPDRPRCSSATSTATRPSSRSSSTRRGSTRRCTSSARRSRPASRRIEERLDRDRGRRRRPRRGAGPLDGQGRRLRGPPRDDAGGHRPRRGRPARPDRHRDGPVMKSKKGDFVLTVDARVARGCDLRVVIEAKDRPMSMRAMRDELREARENRGAAVAVVVFTPAHAPTGVAPFALVGDDVYCVIDPEAPGAGHARSGGPAGPPAGPGLARRARGRGRCRRDRGRADRDPRAARGRPHAQVAADVDLERDQGGLERAWTRCARTSWPASLEAEGEIRGT